MSTNTDELKRLAEGMADRAKKRSEMTPAEEIAFDFGIDDLVEEWQDAANPSAILSLIEEVEQSREMEAHWRDQAQNLNITKEDWRIQFMRADEANGQLRKVEQNLKADNATLRAELDKALEVLEPFGAAQLTSCSVLFSGEDKLKIQAVATFDTDYSQDVIDAFNAANEAASAFTERHKSQGESDATHPSDEGGRDA